MICAYCGEDKTPTREHIIPNGFIKHMKKQGVFTYIDHAPVRTIKGEPMVKDVCADCNNGELSNLDRYALHLFLDANNDISINTSKYYFKYNKDLLTRWLLKVCFNSARGNKAEHAVKLYRDNIDYIMHNGPKKNNIAVYASFMGYDLDGFPTEIIEHLKSEREFEFDWFRITKMNNFGSQTFHTTSRAVFINSLAFLVVVSDDDDEFEEVCDKIHNSEYKFELLKNGKTWLKKEQNLMLQSYVAPKYLLDSFGKERNTPEAKIRVLPLTREQIENFDFFYIEWIIDECMKNRDTLRDCMGSVIISTEGYDDELRELYQCKEYQEYFYHVLLEYPEIICLLNMDDLGINNPNDAIIWAAINKDYIMDSNNPNRDFEYDKEKLGKIVLSVFDAINAVASLYIMDGSFIENMTNGVTEYLCRILKINKEDLS